MANATDEKRLAHSGTFLAEYIGKFIAFKLTGAQSYYYIKLISSVNFLVPHKTCDESDVTHQLNVITIQCKMAEKEDWEKKMLKIMMMMTKFAIL